MNKTEKKDAFAFRVSKEKIKEFSKLSAEEKLNWLEEANNFVATAVPDEKLKRWGKFIGRN
ncbi:MAG: hypothetical protein A2077_01975 [Nitrospirae bacterium GWC2_46_6]|nr:MAG: hypothetical protein A2077_01975 [Nitrospirae bacterium GWC2_46_6]OGW21122.1 MAG: hypothetical protein A2Z82_00705 [Nitrospirae bacterium GWA2_46_11]OGW23833.1 MAG: hypothetical protein A2X55_12030 [Nitrospirae bacterium GWB2_47_37]HAK88497.1 hypothetical protein [Nitrospiraceae bacterium]HCL81509.1 hypothetical protein [Nitrospiraceae bacterium]